MKRIFFLIAALIFISGNNVSAQGFSSNLIGVGVVVTDLEKSLDFYVNAVGMVRAGGFSLDAGFARRSGLSNGVPFDVVVLKLEDSDQANEWKLMSFGNKTKRNKQKFIQDHTGMQYITINVKALNPIIEKLKERQVGFLGETPTPLSDEIFFLLVQDPDGIFVELIGPMN
jgi:catechol 2,3-dioxygenase-like lactoylglutathione lyase family enzyme